MYRKDILAPNRWQVTYLDPATGQTVMSADLSSWDECNHWINWHRDCWLNPFASFQAYERQATNGQLCIAK